MRNVTPFISANMKYFLIPAVLWCYIVSVIAAQKFWGAVFGTIIQKLDLSPNQGWLVPLSINLLVAGAGIPHIVSLFSAWRHREIMPMSRRIACWLCVGAVGLCLNGVFNMAIGKHQQLATGLSEMAGGPDLVVFEAGENMDDVYSNKIVGVSIRLPSQWHPATFNAILRAKHSGAQGISNGKLRQTLQSTVRPPGIYPLFAVFRYPDTHFGYNPSLALTAYDKKVVATRGYPTLEAYASSFAGVVAPYRIRSGPSREFFGRSKGYYIHLELPLPVGAINQHVFVAETDTFYVVLVASVQQEQDLKVLKQAVSTMQISKTVAAK